MGSAHTVNGALNSGAVAAAAGIPRRTLCRWVVEGHVAPGVRRAPKVGATSRWTPESAAIVARLGTARATLGPRIWKDLLGGRIGEAARALGEPRTYLLLGRARILSSDRLDQTALGAAGFPVVVLRLAPP